MTVGFKQTLPGLGLWISLAVCWWMYSPGLSGPFLLDDMVNLEGLAVLQQGVEYTSDAVRGNTSGPLGRPVSMLSFAGSFLVAGGFDARVFKEHNLALHLLTGALVCWLGFLLLRARDTPCAAWAAVFAASLWMLSPLMQSTVLYVVQRMAQLACLFVLAGLICYCKARTTTGKAPAAFLFAFAFGFGAVAVFAKETAIVGLPLALLLEIALFAPRERLSKVFVKRVVAGCVAAALCVSVAIARGWLSSGLLDYSARDFTLTQRLLTEMRVLLDYAGAFLWPLTGGYGIYHDDFPVSRGWLDPAATLTAGVALVVTAIAGIGALVSRRSVIPGLGVLFFLVAHGPESTVLPLEIYFEHRNYLPAVGLALALAWIVSTLAHRVPELRVLVPILAVCLVGCAAGVTGLRAGYWSSPELFTALSVNEHPRSMRANIAYATSLAQAGDPALAAIYNREAGRLARDPPIVVPLRETWLHCISGQTPPQSLLQEVASAMHTFGNPRIDEALDVLVEAVLDGRCALSVGESLSDVLGRFHASGGRLTDRVLGLAVKLDNFLGRHPEALLYAGELVSRDPKSVTGHLMVAYLAGMTGDTGMRAESLRVLGVLACEGQLSLDQRASLAAVRGHDVDDGCDVPD